MNPTVDFDMQESMQVQLRLSSYHTKLIRIYVVVQGMKWITYRASNDYFYRS